MSPQANMRFTYLIIRWRHAVFLRSRSARKKDWFNNTCGGAVAGFSVALLSRYTRSPRMVAAHVAGAAAITSVVAFATGPPVGS